MTTFAAKASTICLADFLYSETCHLSPASASAQARRRSPSVALLWSATWSLRTPPPCGKTVPPDQQVALRPLPYRLERRPVVEAFRNQHRIALPLAMADAAIGVVDDASFRRHEPVLVLAPAVRQKRGGSYPAPCCGGADSRQQRQDQSHHSHITDFPARG